MYAKALVLSALGIGMATILPAGAEDKKDHHPKLATHPGLEKFKALAGDWVGKGSFGGKDESEITVNYKVTSNGSAVVETLGEGKGMEMVSVIHADGDALIFTHYCALGNQPRMKAEGKWDKNTIAFKFIDATNLKSEKDMHMHDVTFTFIDKDTLKSEWTHYHDGKPGGQVVFNFKRKK
jgi:hypothetical protein